MNSINRKLYILSIFFLPFLSLPVMPSVYRPISIIFLCFPAIIFLFNSIKYKHFNPYDRQVLLLFSFIIIHSLTFLIFADISLSHYFKEIMVLCLGLIAYFGFRHSFSTYGFDIFLKYSLYSYRLILLIGLIEVFAIYGILPNEIKQTINLLLSGKANTRIQLATMEASWAARTLMFYFPVLMYLLSSKSMKVYLIEVAAGLVIFFLIFSLDGYIILAISYCIYLIATKQIKKASIIVVAAIPFVLLFIYLAGQSGGYYFTRIQNIISGEYYQFSDLLYLDQSVFIRLGYLYNAISIWFNHLMGIGLGQYSLYFNESLIGNFGYEVIQFPDVANHILSNSGDPRSLYLKAACESSVIALLILLILIKSCWNRIKLIKEKNAARFFKVYLIMTSVSLFAFESWAYLYLWLAIAIIASIKGKT